MPMKKKNIFMPMKNISYARLLLAKTPKIETL